MPRNLLRNYTIAMLLSGVGWLIPSLINTALRHIPETEADVLCSICIAVGAYNLLLGGKPNLKLVYILLNVIAFPAFLLTLTWDIFILFPNGG